MKKKDLERRISELEREIERLKKQQRPITPYPGGYPPIPIVPYIPERPWYPKPEPWYPNRRIVWGKDGSAIPIY